MNERPHKWMDAKLRIGRKTLTHVLPGQITPVFKPGLTRLCRKMTLRYTQTFNPGTIHSFIEYIILFKESV